MRAPKRAKARWGRFAVDVGAAGAQMLADAAANALIPGAGLALMGTRAFGSGSQQARQEGASVGKQAAYGLGRSALSIGTEKIANIAKPLNAAYGAGVVEKALPKALHKMASTKAGHLAASALSEAGEEFLEDLIDPIIQRSIFHKNAELDLGDALYDALVGGTLGLMGVGLDLRNERGEAENPLVRGIEEEMEWRDGRRENHIRTAESQERDNAKGKDPKFELEKVKPKIFGEAKISVLDELNNNVQLLSSDDERAFLDSSGPALNLNNERTRKQQSLIQAEYEMYFRAKNKALNKSELLPNHEHAIIPDSKIVGYALNRNHPLGKHKALVFKEVLGYDISNSNILVNQIIEGLKVYRATTRQPTQYGRPFQVKMLIQGVNGRFAPIITGWIIDKGSDVPRLVSVYIIDER